MEVILFFAGICFGISMGIGIGNVLKKNKPVGSLKAVLDENEGNKPYLFLELDRSIDDLYEKDGCIPSRTTAQITSPIMETLYLSIEGRK